MVVFERRARSLALLGFCAASTLAVGCDSRGYEDALLGADYAPVAGNDEAGAPTPDAGMRDDGGSGSTGKCIPASTSEPLPAREEVLAHAVPGGSDERVVFTTDLFSRFVDHCGSCHAGLAAQGRRRGRRRRSDETRGAPRAGDAPAPPLTARRSRGRPDRIDRTTR